jgi:hypothetical protein
MQHFAYDQWWRRYFMSRHHLAQVLAETVLHAFVVVVKIGTLHCVILPEVKIGGSGANL